MVKTTDPALSALLREFETIRTSLVPIISEVKKMKENKIEQERTKRDFDARLRKLDFEIRSTKQKNDVPKEIAILQDKITRLSKEMSLIKSTKIPEVKHEFSGEIEEQDATQKASVSKLKNRIDEINEKEIKMKKILDELEQFKRHEQQIVNELNKQKTAILKTMDDIKKQVNKTEAIAIATTKIDKKQGSDIGDVKNRIYQLEKRIGQNGIEDLKKSIEHFKEKMFGELDQSKQRLLVLEKKNVNMFDISKVVKEAIINENAYINKILSELRSDIENIKSRTDTVVKDLDSINIKVNSTSKIISEIEKVL